MKIKSLLLGSAAALFAVSTAQAADAIVVEPEPVEYEWVSIGHGRFAKREASMASQTFDSDYVDL